MAEELIRLLSVEKKTRPASNDKYGAFDRSRINRYSPGA
jgi:hypothetical protein